MTCIIVLQAQYESMQNKSNVNKTHTVKRAEIAFLSGLIVVVRSVQRGASRNGAIQDTTGDEE